MLITEDNAVFISSLLDPHAEHLVNLLKKSQLLRSITRGVGLLELHFGERNSSEQFWYINSLFLLVFWGGTVLRLSSESIGPQSTRLRFDCCIYERYTPLTFTFLAPSVPNQTAKTQSPLEG